MVSNPPKERQALKAIIIKDAYPHPWIYDSLDTLSGATLFSIHDLASGYLQVRMAEAVMEKSTFVTEGGLDQFKAMPFVPCGSPATFE